MTEKFSEPRPSARPGRDPGEEPSRQRLRREIKERVERGEYWVDLDFLACLLVDSQAVAD